MDWIPSLPTPPALQQLARSVHGQQVEQETFRLPTLWSLHFYEYHGELALGDQRHRLQPGACSLIPPGSTATFHYEGRSEHLYCHFAVPDAADAKSASFQFFAPDPRLPQLKSLLAGAIPLRTASPQRADLRLWDVLLGLHDLKTQPDPHPRHARVVETVTEIALQEMADPLSIAQLARRCQLSHNQLTRILKQQTGTTPATWLRRLRTDRAAELLRYSDLPIKVIAAEVGYPDLQHFNKVIRRRFETSPTGLREERFSTDSPTDGRKLPAPSSIQEKVHSPSH